jgi:hypothetical protein
VLLSSQVCSSQERADRILFNKPIVMDIPAAKTAGKSIFRKYKKRKKNTLAGSASFFSKVLKSLLLSSEYSCLRLLKALTKIFSSAGGWLRLNIPNPKKGFATNNNTAKQKYILAVLYNCMFISKDII